MKKRGNLIFEWANHLRSASGIIFAAAIPWGHVTGYIAGCLGLITLPFSQGYKYNPKPKRILLACLWLFLLWGLVLTFTISIRPGRSFETIFGYFGHWILPFLLGYAICAKFRIPIVYIWIISLLALGLASLPAYLGWIDAPRLSSEGLLKGLHTHIQFGTLLLMALHFLLAFFLIPGLEKKRTVIYGIAALLASFMIILTGSRGVWFAGIVSITGALIHSVIVNRRRGPAIAFLVLGSISAAIAIFAFPQVRARIDRTGRDDLSYIYRRNMYIMAGDILSENPVFGIGPGQVKYAKKYYDRMEAAGLPVETGYLKKNHLHNMFLHTAAEFGLPGLGLLGIILASIVWIAILAIKSSNELSRGTAYGFLWATVAIATGELLDCLLRGPPIAMEFFFFAGILAGIASQSSGKKSLRRGDKVLIAQADSLCDEATAFKIARALKARYPGITVDLLCRSDTIKTAGTGREIDKVLPFENGISKVAKQINKNRYKIAILANPDRKAAFALWFAEIPVRIGSGHRIWSPFLLTCRLFRTRKNDRDFLANAVLELYDAKL